MLVLHLFPTIFILILIYLQFIFVVVQLHFPEDVNVASVYDQM